MSSYYLSATLGIRLVHAFIGLIWVGVAAAVALLAYMGATQSVAAIDLICVSQVWLLVAGTLLAGIVTAGTVALAWQRFASSIRPITESPRPAPSGSATVDDGRTTSAP
ncbi:hypothetical protein [Frigoribacterium sp. CFBP9030]|uniref:hypothetical protein n=1 Tax=Frigoribacterium sp. CFBP9030 TaxID=3096537 RepID=UPI002A6AD3DB|nr:hypothetical protein [Frigoribacterium sp. CFBP9030]MDY0891640.1 hypothetical protein [Frigoribacterium sp. CFBP9030]